MTDRACRPFNISPAMSTVQTWPNGKRLAIYVALGLECYEFGVGCTEDILPKGQHPDFANVAWREYGNRVGGLRLIERLKHFGIPPTILLNTDLYALAPDLLEHARFHGSEIVAHGKRNSDTLTSMDPALERTYIRDVFAAVGRHEGRPSQGWSTPWLAHSPSTMEVLVEERCRYILDFRFDDQPVWLETANGRLMSIPYSSEINDSTTQVGRYAGARDFADMIVDEFDEMLEASNDRPLVMSIVLHSFISGQPFRRRALSHALQHIADHKADVWLTTPAEIYAAVA